MFRYVGGFIGFLMSLGFGPIGWILGIFLGSSLGRSLDSLIFGSGRNRTNFKSSEEAYRKFYEQFTQNAGRTSWSGYTHGGGNGYTGYQNPGATESCYSQIGCSSSDSNDVIKRSYRKMVSKFHPDRIAGSGVTGVELERAEAKFKEIQDSYNRIKKERGI